MTKLDIYANRELIGAQLLKFIKGEGYTKASFAKLIDVEKEILDKVLVGNINDEIMYLNILKSILDSVDVKVEVLIDYKYECLETQVPISSSIGEDLLDNILDLYEIYN